VRDGFTATLLGQFNTLLFEERNQSALQTPLAVHFVKSRGLFALTDLLSSRWNEVKEVQELAGANLKDRVARERLGALHGTIELILNALTTLTDSKLVSFQGSKNHCRMIL
jgi:hypothetical protein